MLSPSPNTSPAPSSLTILALLEDFVARHPEERISVRSLTEELGEHGLLLLLLVFALFCAIPLPIPGIHVILSMPLFYVTTQQMMGRRVIWFPDSILNRTLPRSGFVALLEKSGPWFHKLETYVHQRLTSVTHDGWYKILGGVAFFITCIIVIPLPLTNVVPSLAIAVIALGMLCHDGVTTLIGTTIGLLWCAMWLALAGWLGWAGMKGIYALLFA